MDEKIRDFKPEDVGGVNAAVTPEEHEANDPADVEVANG